jgi:hypothetical protein
MPKMVCPDCQCEYKVLKNGVYVIEMASLLPYKIWTADLWKCPDCNKEIVAGFAREALEHYELDFNQYLESITEDDKVMVIYDYERPKSKESHGAEISDIDRDSGY